jgi:predicted amidohydrolase
MRICVAQARSFKGDVQTNIDHHKKLIDLAVSQQSDLIIFPELSLTGYEPTLAGKLAVTMNDARFDIFQNISDTKTIAIGAGTPVKSEKGVHIGMLLFQPDQPRQLSSKKYLHPDEEEFFVGGENNNLKIKGATVALAICYEISIEAHTASVLKEGAAIYVASVAKVARGIVKVYESLSKTARKYEIPVMMANCIGECDGDVGAGQSAVWNSKGELVQKLSESQEGLLIFDTLTEEVIHRELTRRNLTF